MKGFDKRKIFKVVLLFLEICVILFFVFLFGYSLGLQHKHSYFISNLLPDFLTELDEGETEIVKKTFHIKSVFDEKNISITNIVSFPHSWYFDEEENVDISDISNAKKYVISSSNEKVKLTITPKSINDIRNVMSATTVFTQEIQRRCLGSYSISESEEFKSIELYREIVDSNNIVYVQEVNSAVDPVEETLVLEEFFVFKRIGGFIKGDELVWTADISLEFDESVSNEEKEAYLVIIDEIVSSLQIK